ncbi:hypothetical protein QBC32DRAFT_337523 [Pseudoneurospora amorphoporcata]|uniref:DUF1279 domain-containing protein n=1 Tax=Pseudoneurospora amorphoporcata TaxID=241081 RepID=A0AAN6NXT7_9PEZI|nr:hypothetical protein QBC32DRAFT_337523 [Pseudoneurospora amorphoporcata]
MLRTGYGATETLLRGGVVFRRAARDTTGVARTWAQHISTKSAATPQLQYASLSVRIRQASRIGQPKQFTTSSRRPFQSSRSRRSEKSSEQEGAKEKAKGKAKEPEPTGFSARMKQLSREYGWTAVGVYLALSVLDFPFCFLLVRTVGTEKIAHFEHIVVSWFEKAIPQSVQDFWRKYRTTLKDNKRERTGEESEETAGWGVEAAEERSKQAGASLATQLALAYAIHKSFIFVRVPLTAAILPKVVKVLRSWGYQIGTKKAAKTVVKAAKKA